MDGYRTALRRATCLGVLAGCAIAAPASADWVEPLPAPLNDPTASAFNAPSIADVNGTAYAALAEQTASGGDVLEVVRQVGSGWQPVGAPLTTAPLAQAPQIAAVAGTVYVAWSQASTSDPFSGAPDAVYADYLSGSTWTPAGPQPLNVSPADDAQFPSIAAVNGAPEIAFADKAITPAQSAPAPHDVIVERYVSGTWSPVGNPLPPDAGNDVSGTSIVSSGGTTYVAWSEQTTYSGQIEAASYGGAGWNPPTTVIGGSPDLAGPLALAGSPTGEPYLAYGSWLGDAGGVLVRVGSGDWTAAGGALTDSPGDSISSAPSITEIGGTPYVAFVQTSADESDEAIVKELGNSGWVDVGTPLTSGLTDYAVDASVGAVGGVPFVSWVTGPCGPAAAGFNAYVASLAAGASNTAATSCPTALSIVSQSFPRPTVGVYYSISLTASGGLAPYSWAATGSPTGLPPGLSLSTSGVVSGTPTASGDYDAPFSVTDAYGNSAVGHLRLPVNPAPAPAQTSTTTNSTSTASTPASGELGSTGVVAAFNGVTLPSATLTMTPTGLATLTLGCPKTTPGGRCRGVAALFAATGSLPASVASVARTRPAARITADAFNVTAGHDLGVRLSLPKAQRQFVVAHGHLAAKLVVTSRDAAGQTRTQTFTVTVHLAAVRSRR